MDQIIKIEKVNLWYEKGKPNEVHALKDIDIEIERGDYVAFFGPSGCGKTSMLYSISGIDRFQEGHVYINGQDIAGLTNQELAIFRQTGIGIVFQQFNLVPSLTVLKNVALPMLFVGVSSERAEEEAKKLLDRLNLTTFASRYPYELSGGQQQRVGIARALANNPPIIIADEPLGNLDSVNAKIVLEFLKELNEKDGRTVIMVTHEAWSLKDAKTIFHIKDGSIIEVEKVGRGNVADIVSKRLHDQISEMSSPGEKQAFGNEKVSARILANFLLRGYSIEEIKRFEEFVNNRFDNKLDKKKLKELLNKPFKEGGLGLWKKKSEKVTNYIEEVVEVRKDVACVYDILKEGLDLSINKEVEVIRNWLIEGYTGKLKGIQLKAIDQVIEDRLRDNISREKVVEVLDMSNNKFGVGLSFRAASTMAEKLELILNNESEEVCDKNLCDEDKIKDAK
ncbi:MAG: ABC transporter ATP-binding protein [Candidatus Moranbacteria bacterium]|nr:ABC transporter ATP-binding protein [Candidatus Moranbacteria bacterium]